MDPKFAFLSIVAFLFPIGSLGDIYNYWECNYELMNKAQLSATSSLPHRGPKNAILHAYASYSRNAWTAGTSDFEQRLIIDLGQVMNVTRIWTQGRPSSSEYVMEYTISYGTDNLDYADYRDPSGNIRMFKGNTDGDTIKKNEFEVPIIAQWIRINPTRWRDRISMRVELFGCEYASETLHFNGTSLLKKDLLREPISAYRETIKFRFKTSYANGVILYSKGTQQDYVALQLKDNRMLLNVDLGSGTVTSLSVGSLLDNNIWHDVVVSRNRRNILFSVDRVVVEGKIEGEFTKLDLNRALYVGGVPYAQEGIVVVQNFTGCLENFYLNSTNLFLDVKQAIEYGYALRYEKVNTQTYCSDSPIIPLTFTTSTAHLTYKGYVNIQSFQVSFQFRTYEKTGLMLYHHFNMEDSFVAIYLEYGRIKVDLTTTQLPTDKLILDNYEGAYNDGLWHTVELRMTRDRIALAVDDVPMITTRLLNVLTGAVYKVGGGVENNIGLETDKKMIGFIGCMREVTVDGNIVQYTNHTADGCAACELEIIQGTCRMDDRCNPNPCEHGGTCTQNSETFECLCPNGYGGSVCHVSLKPLSCEAFRRLQNVGQREELEVDIDGSGPLAPFPVTCEYYSDGRVGTVLHHGNQQTTIVDGFQEPGSFKQDIHYEADDDQIEALVNRSATCKQKIQYDCKGSRLFNSPSDENSYQPFSWWISRNNQKMDYWGGALPGSRKCLCGIMGNCVDPNKWCNCDTGALTWNTDVGDLAEKENLPVRQLRFGDTGHALDDKEGRYTLGPLICEGDTTFDNVITFRISDATIDLPPFDMSHSGDIYFEFRTTIHNAVIFESKGPADFIRLSITGGNQLQFQYSAGGGVQTVPKETTNKLADNNWHSVSIERNRKAAMLVIDGSLKTEVPEPKGPVRALHLPGKFVLGASSDYRDGFTGCIRAFQLNGKLIDLKSYARKGLYGISEGCVGKCVSNPCLNNGTCHERYDGYSCDCRWTAFKGPICADEIGVNMRQSSMIKYTFPGSFRSTISEKIRVGFTTTHPKGFLLGFSSKKSKEYLTIMISNSGHLRVVFDFGFERREIIYQEKTFMFGQFHDLRLSRKNGGATVVIQMDDYEPKEYTFDIKESADAQFNNIEYMYIGRNESMSEGFVGCISRVEFHDIYPLKWLFQQDKPASVEAVGTSTEDFCGVEPITHPPDLLETRPPPDLDEDKLRQAYRQTDSAILGSILAVLFLILVIIAVLIGRYMHRHKGAYLTQEDVGADAADDPDTAVVMGATGHHVEKKKEYYI